MTETLFAVVDAAGVVENVIVADQEFIDGLTAAVADPNHDTGTLTVDHVYVNVTALDPQPGVQWTYKNDVFVAPLLPEPPPKAAAAQAAMQAQRTEEDVFLTGLRDKMAKGVYLSQDERDRMQVIQLTRNF